MTWARRARRRTRAQARPRLPLAQRSAPEAAPAGGLSTGSGGGVFGGERARRASEERARRERGESEERARRASEESERGEGYGRGVRDGGNMRGAASVSRCHGGWGAGLNSCVQSEARTPTQSARERAARSRGSRDEHRLSTFDMAVVHTIGACQSICKRAWGWGGEGVGKVRKRHRERTVRRREDVHADSCRPVSALRPVSRVLRRARSRCALRRCDESTPQSAPDEDTTRSARSPFVP